MVWMDKSYPYRTNKWIASEIILGVIFLVCGCAIYLLFRSKTLNIYQWCMMLGMDYIIDSLRYAVQEWNIAAWIRYSLPDGLYCSAYILIIDAIWHDDNRLIKFVIISLIPLVTISSELLQYFGLAKGTFDIYDLICYLMPPIIFLIYTYKSFMFNKLKI